MIPHPIGDEAGQWEPMHRLGDVFARFFFIACRGSQYKNILRIQYGNLSAQKVRSCFKRGNC